VVAVVSQPDRPRGRGRRLSASPVAARAQAAGIALLRPAQVGAPEVEVALRAARPDVGVVVAFGQFLPKRVRELPRLGFLINAHASLLPKLRGAAPIARAILAGESETGISVMRVEREMDAGPVALVKRTGIGVDEDAGSLGARLAVLAAEAIAEALARIASGSLTWTDQPTAGITFAPKLEREEARLDFRAPAASLALRVRAFAPRPGAFTELAGEPLRILAAHAIPGLAAHASPGLAAHASPGASDEVPGTIRLDADGKGLRIATGEGWLLPRVLQRAGGRVLDAAEFLRGARLSDGNLLGA
jgi:methionyl-tRNA formyltransferase